ncbi:hypothetical protein V6U81_13095 [Micromonospora sp. CPCC 205711]|uniref:hypothetical protein n=1 Tax=Micromonospora sp. CPCC 205547 TaxID=3122400 RepID=UPI002FF1DE90
MFGVHDGDDSAGEGAGPGPAGSAQIEDLFEGFFAGRGLPTNAADFTGRSDHGPFIVVGIPAGGLFTGSSRETQRQRQQLGRDDPAQRQLDLADGLLPRRLTPTTASAARRPLAGAPTRHI